MSGALDLFITAIDVGGGTTYFRHDTRADLELLNERRFGRRRVPAISPQNLAEAADEGEAIRGRSEALAVA